MPGMMSGIVSAVMPGTTVSRKRGRKHAAAARWLLSFMGLGLCCVSCDGSAGAPGKPGDSGTNGTSCTVTSNADGGGATGGATGTVAGGVTIRCTDGTTATVASGTNGTNGINGSNGTPCTLVTNSDGTRTLTCGGSDAGAEAGSVVLAGTVVDYTVLTPDEQAQAVITAAITSVTVPADGRPVVALTITERHGYGVKNLIPGNVNWRFALLKSALGVNNSADATWVSYLAINDHSAASSETALAANMTDNGDGTYSYRFAKAINAGPAAAGTTYDPSAVHRLIVLLYQTSNSFAPINLVKDFIPATGVDVTGQYEKVDGKACLECHTTFRAITGGTGELGSGEFHSGVRYDIRTCVACHNDQRRFSATGDLVTEPAIGLDGTWTGNAAVLNGEAVINLPVFIHRIHMGSKLQMTGGTFAGVPKPYETTYPQDVRNCTKCHRAPAPFPDTWKTQLSRRSCGACHDGRSFEVAIPNGRVMHSGGAQPDDKNCAVCHVAGAVGGDTPSKHLSVSPPNPLNIYLNSTAAANANTNAAYVAAAGAVPKGAQVITYLIKSVSTWSDTAAAGVLRPQIVFKLVLDGKDVVFPSPTAGSELVPNFVGSPSAYFAFAVPQDGKIAPADFNATASAYIRNVWNGTGTCSNAAATTTRTGAGILTGPDATGFYTLQLTCAVIPAGATMLTGGIGYTYGLGSRQAPPNPDLDFVNNTQPLTQTNLPAYPYVPNKKLDGVTPGYGGTGGLILPPPDVSMVATGFTGRRAIVENARCGACHVSLGVGPDFHAGQRNDATTCAWCHRPNQTSSGWSANAKDFVHAIHGAEKRSTNFTWHEESATDGFFNTTYPGVLNKCEMCHLPGTYDFSSAATVAAYPNMLPSTVGQGTYATGTVNAPYVTVGVAYGAGFAVNALTGVSTPADPTTLVVSPLVAACSACHDSSIAVDHMQTNGGSFYESRAVAFAKPQQEECLLCHGPGRLASIADRHAVLAP